VNHRIRYLALLLAATFCSTGSAYAQSPSADSAQSVVVKGQKNPSRWFRAESQHFIVYSDTRQEDVSQLLNQLEKLDDVLRIFTKNYLTSRPSQHKLTLYYHNRAEGLDGFVDGQPDEAVGLYNSCAAGVQGFGVHLQRIETLNDDQLARHTLNSSLSYLFEAYTRHFIYRYTDIRLPLSYIDGFAQYFSSLRFSDTHMVLGRVPTGAGRFLHFLDKGRRYHLSYQDILDPTGAVALDTQKDPAKRLEFLARSWLLTHYMLSSGANMARLDRYLDLVDHEVPAAKAFEQAFGVKAADIGDILWRYRNKGIQTVQIDLPSLPSARMNFTALPEAATDFILADASLKSCPNRETGESLLRTISASAKGLLQNEQAAISLSRAQIDWGNPQDALPYLSDAVRKDARNADAAYLLGVANWRLAERSKDADRQTRLAAAREQLLLARKLAPHSPEPAFALYRVELDANDRPADAAWEAAVAAWRNAHEVSKFAKSAALAFAYTGRAPEADQALTLMTRNTRDPDTASWAKTWQGKLNKGVTRSELLAEMRRAASEDTSFREWTVASENLMRTVEYNAGVDDSRSYFDSLRLGDPTTSQGSFNSMPRSR